MKVFEKVIASALCASISGLLSLAPALAQHIPVPDNFIIEGVPPIPTAIADGADRYTNFRMASHSDWHPQRREMLITTRFADTQQIHAVKVPGGARSQLTFFPDRVGGGTYQPTEGDYFIFSKDRGGDEFFQKYRFDVATKKVTLLTDGKSRNTGGVFSTKGDLLAYSSTRRDGKNNDVYLIDPRRPESDRLLIKVKGEGWSVRDYSPDDSKLLLVESISANESYLWLADLGTAALKPLTRRTEGQTAVYDNACFTRDGRGVYATTDNASQFQQLMHIDIESGKQTPLQPSIKWDIEDIALSKDGKWLAFVVNENGFGKLHVISTGTLKEKPVKNLPRGTVGGLSWHNNSLDLAFTMDSSQSPADVFSWNVKTGSVERWTFSETGMVNAQAFVEPELIKWKSFDGKEIPGLLIRPPEKFKGRRPVVVIIHGGPEGQSRPGFMGRLNYYLDELGVALILPNIRGSTGYGKDYLKLDNGFLRADSYRDIDALFDWIKTRNDLDSNRILVTGGSYGGHMTLAVATHFPEKFRAAVDIVGMSNLVTFLERTQEYRRDLRRIEYGDERDPKMREFLEKIAPLNLVDKITKPLFVIQGENDPRVPASEARQIVDALKKRGTPVWYLSAKDEGHGFAKKKNADFQFYATLSFVRQFLLDGFEEN